MDLVPLSIERVQENILIKWSDKTDRLYSPGKLRQHCPCAICREKKKSPAAASSGAMPLPVLTQAETLPLRIERMEPVGNYAYNIHFSDGHHSGIYTFDLLSQLAEKRPPESSQEN